MCANLAIIGIKNCWHGRRAIIFEAILQASFILLQANNIAGWRNEDNSLVRTELYSLGQIFIFRNARLIKDMRMIKSFEFIVQTLGYLTKPILTKFFFIYLVFYEYAYLGEIIFGGHVTYEGYMSMKESYPPLYYLMNFNDFGSSLVVLYQ